MLGELPAHLGRLEEANDEVLVPNERKRGVTRGKLLLGIRILLEIMAGGYFEWVGLQEERMRRRE
jgi:hypothetical protein